MVDGQLHGDNTDGQGLVDAIHALDWSLEQTDVLIIGAGGATAASFIHWYKQG